MYKCYHMVFFFFRLTSLSMIISRSILITVNGIISFVFMAEEYSYIYIYTYISHLYPFIFQWTFRLFPCLAYCEWCCYEHRVHASFWIIVLPEYMPWRGLLDHFIFWGTSTLFSVMTAPFYIPTKCVGQFPFLHTLSSIWELEKSWKDVHLGDAVYK